MKLNEMSFDKQVKYLKAFLKSEEPFLKAYLALFAFRHNLISKHSQRYSLKPVVRWYLGQLAKAYITRYYNGVKGQLNRMASMGLLEVKGDEKNPIFMEYHLNDSLFPALQEALEEIFGKDFISDVIHRAKYYRDPDSRSYDEDEKNLKDSRRRKYEGRS